MTTDHMVPPSKKGRVGSRLSSARRVDVSPNPVLLRLMLPLTAGLIIVGISVASYIANQQRNLLRESSGEMLSHISVQLQTSLAEQSRSLAMVEDMLVQKADLREALKAKNRQRLLADYAPLFASLKSDFGLTHMYFMDPERVCLLRLHDPEKSGDRIDRFTIQEAERTGKTASGIELGPLGTLTLRVVKPVFESDTLIGYLELGREIEEIFVDLQKHPGIELAATINKSSLKRESWEYGMKLLGHNYNWERFANHALIYSSLSPFPAEADRYVGVPGHLLIDADTEIMINGASWQIMNMPLPDVSGAVVGELIVLYDISALKADYHRRLAVIGGGTLVFMATLLVALFLLIQKTDARIRDQEEALRDREERLNFLVTNSPSVIYTCRPSGDYGTTFVSQNVVHQTGYEASEFLADSGFWTDSIHPDDAPRISAGITTLIAKGSSTLEYRFRHKDGKWQWMHDEMKLILNAAGEPLEILGSCVNITALKKAEERITQNLKEKELLLREIHHRVKNNMAVISGLLDLQSGRIQEDSLRELFNESRQRIKSMALVHEKLYNTEDLSRIDFGDYIRSITKDLISSYNREGREITTKISVGDIMLDIESAIPCGLIINELITNAMKHAFRGKTGGEITVSFTKSCNSYTLLIHDNGIGLPEGFDYTKNNSLGLQLVDALTRQLKGNLNFQSGTAAHQGTSVIMTFSEKEGETES